MAQHDQINGATENHAPLGPRWLAAGVMAAGLGAAIMTSQAVATASPEDNAASEATSTTTSDKSEAAESPSVSNNGTAGADTPASTSGDATRLSSTAQPQSTISSRQAARVDATDAADDRLETTLGDDEATEAPDDSTSSEAGDVDSSASTDSETAAESPSTTEVPSAEVAEPDPTNEEEPVEAPAPVAAAELDLDAAPDLMLEEQQQDVGESGSAPNQDTAATDQSSPAGGSGIVRHTPMSTVSADHSPLESVALSASAAAIGTDSVAVSALSAASVQAQDDVAPPTTIAAATPLVTLQTIVTDFLRWLGFSPPTFNWQFPVLNFFQSIWTGLQQLFQWSPAPAPPPPSTSTGTEPELLWESNFSDMDDALSSWTVQTGRWGASAGENQYYTSGTSNAYLDQNGNLVIEARQETPPDGMGAPFDYTSARVVTYGNQSFEPPVRITARIKMPDTQGILPAFWTVGLKPGHEFDWPDQGEIDIVELPGVNSPDQSSSWTGNIHGPAEADGAVDGELTGIDADIGVDLSADFHEYGIDWYPDHITWHVDGAEVGTITQAEYEAMGGDWTPFSGAWPHYLILTLAVGNPWTGDPDASSTFPQQMLVDWVRVWSLTPELTTAV